MSSSSPSYLTREQLAALLQSSQASSVAVIDVRDDDHVGGHIRGSVHAPSSSLDHALPDLVRRLAPKSTVVFHCALSQQRGPTAARRYLREKQRMESTSTQEQDKAQTVYILDGGFVKWQELYGSNAALTEAYAPDVWASGY